MKRSDVFVFGQYDDIETQPLGDLSHFVVEFLAGLLDFLLPFCHQLLRFDFTGVDHRDRGDQAGDGNRDTDHGEDEVEEPVSDFLNDES